MMSKYSNAGLTNFLLTGHYLGSILEGGSLIAVRAHKRLFILLFAGIIAGSFSVPREARAIKGWKKITNNLGSSLKKAVPKKENKAEPKSRGGIGGFFDKLKKKVEKVVKNIKKKIVQNIS